MSNTNSSISDADIDILVQEFYQIYVDNLVDTSALALLLYATVLNISQEKEYIWKKPFSLPTFLYILARYTPLFDEALALTINLLPITVSIQSCNIIGDVTTAMQVLGYIGVQGLLIARAYALCRGNKIITTLLAFTFLAGLFFILFGIITFPGCIIDPKSVREADLLQLLGNISVILTDAVVFAACFYNVWETWKLKRGTGLQRENDLVTILFRQIISRSFFVVFSALAIVILDILASDVAILGIIGAIQNSLSAILITGFTLDLRYRNSATIATKSLSLPPIRSVQDVLQHVHQSFLMDMGDHESTDVGNMADTPGPQVAESQSDSQFV